MRRGRPSAARPLRRDRHGLQVDHLRPAGDDDQVRDAGRLHRGRLRPGRRVEHDGANPLGLDRLERRPEARQRDVGENRDIRLAAMCGEAQLDAQRRAITPRIRSCGTATATAWCVSPAAGARLRRVRRHRPARPGPGCGPYRNCTALRRDHPNGVPRGHSAYQRRMDRDNDGRACER